MEIAVTSRSIFIQLRKENSMAAHDLSWLKSEHRELLREIAELRSWWASCHESNAPNFGEMSRRVMDLHDRLAAHFAREEEGQILKRAAEIRPPLASNVAQLLNDHQRFRTALDELALKLARGTSSYTNWEEPWKEMEKILTALAEHETTENAVLAAAFGDNYRDSEGNAMTQPE
jgi:iron-sulfur cluster repair protein YtfE (RIC family)